MELNSIINDNDISMKMRDIYKYISKNEDKFNEIFNLTFDDLKNMYSDVTKEEDTITIISDNIVVDRNKVHSTMQYHANQLLGDNDYITPYAFRINTGDNTIKLIKKH